MRAHTTPSADELGTLPAQIGVRVGDPAPDARLTAADGHEVSLRALAAHGAIMIVFYRGGWCPFCNFQIHELTQASPELQRRGVTPVAISVDRIDEASRTRATYDIPFPVLSDPDLVAHRAYRVVHQVDAAELSRLGGFGIDLERSSGRTHHVIAIPSIFIVDRAGVVRWAHANPDYKIRPSVPQLLAVIEGLHLPRP